MGPGLVGESSENSFSHTPGRRINTMNVSLNRFDCQPPESTPLPCDEGRDPQFYVRIATHGGGNPLCAGWYVMPGFTSARVALMYAEARRAKGDCTVRVVDAYGVEVPADAGDDVLTAGDLLGSEA